MTKVVIPMSGRAVSSLTNVAIFSPDSRINCRDAIPITTERMMIETGSSFVRPEHENVSLVDFMFFCTSASEKTLCDLMDCLLACL